MKWVRVCAIAGAILAVGPVVVNQWAELMHRTSSPADAHIDRGRRAMTDGRYAEAAIAFGRAQKLDPDRAEADLGLMRARVYSVAEEPSRLGDEGVEEMRYDAELLIERDPKGAAAYHTALGHLLARKGDLAGARAKYEQALALDPSSALAHTALGNAYLGDKDRMGQAAPEFDAALKAKPGHASALVGLARVALSKGDAEQAVKHLTAALASREDASTHILLGNAQVRLKNLSDGITHLQRAAQLEPRNGEALKSLGQALMAADRSAEAERALRAAAQLGEDLEAAIGLGFALSRQRKQAQALDAFTQVLSRDPDAPLALFGAGVALEELGKHDDAASMYRRLLALKSSGGPGGKDNQGLAQVQEDARSRLGALTGGPPEASGDGSAASAASGASPATGASGAPATGPATKPGPAKKPTGAQRIGF